jgi:broad specificity phosphatase PhoE
MGRIVLVRAGTTDFDEQDRIAGTLDLPVNVRGRAELAEAAQELRQQPIEVLYACAGESAQESAAILGEQLGVRVRLLENLRNLDFGLWQGLQVSEVKRKHKSLFKQWNDNPDAICPPAGEMVQDVLDRVHKALRQVLKRHREDVIGIVAPEPLRKVIKAYLTRRPVTCILGENGQGAAWEAIDLE